MYTSVTELKILKPDIFKNMTSVMTELPRYPEAQEHVGALKDMDVHVLQLVSHRLYETRDTRLDTHQEKLLILNKLSNFPLQRVSIFVIGVLVIYDYETGEFSTLHTVTLGRDRPRPLKTHRNTGA